VIENFTYNSRNRHKRQSKKNYMMRRVQTIIKVSYRVEGLQVEPTPFCKGFRKLISDGRAKRSRIGAKGESKVF